MTVFRAMWPITHPTVPLQTLLHQATHDLPRLTAQTHAQLTGPGRWCVADSRNVPGSGRITDLVLLYEAPAIHARRELEDAA